MPKSKPNKRKSRNHPNTSQSQTKLGQARIEQWKRVFQAIAAAYSTVTFTDHGTNETYRQANFSLRYNLASVEGFSVAFLFNSMEKGELPPAPEGAIAWIAQSNSLMTLIPGALNLPKAKIQYRGFKQ